MEMVIVEVFVPALSARFDFKIPTGRRLGDVIREMVQSLEVTQNNIKFDEDALLCDMDHMKVFSPEKYVAEVGIRDGSRLMLV